MSLSVIGNAGLGFAFLSALLSLVLPGRFRQEITAAKLTASLSVAQFFFISISFFTLMYAYVVSDFSIVTVALHSHTTKPLLYKIAGVWGNHEGSMLLWVLISTSYGALFAYFSAKENKTLYRHTLFYLSLINLLFFLYISLTSNPFFTTEEAIPEGRGMNPLLQDPSMSIHPPLLYLGYVGFILPFAMVLAGLRHKDFPLTWFIALRPWVLLTWGALTIGITLGSYWAYYELGWGGWWFWDPVENASLMPWVFGTTLLHSLLLTSKRQALLKWSTLLVYICFIFCILGAFLTRSGVLSSVHSFATSPERGFYIMIFVSLASTYFFLRFLHRFGHLKSTPTSLVSREGGVLIGTMLLSLMGAIIFLGTFYPLFAELIKGQQITLEAPFFNMTLAPLTILLMVLMGGVPLTSWGTVHFSSLWRSLQVPLFFFMVGILVSLFIYDQKFFYATIFISLSLYLISATLVSLKRYGFSLPFKKYATHLAHLGFGLLILGIVVDSYNVQETIKVMKVGDSAQLGDFTFTFNDIQQLDGPNFRREKATLSVTKKKTKITQLFPEKRLYLAEKALMSEISLAKRGLSEFYAVLGDYQGNESWLFRLYYHPLVLLIWIGGLMIGLGGLLGILRFGGRFSSHQD